MADRPVQDEEIDSEAGVEITSEMIRAGQEVLWRINWSTDQEAEVLSQIYNAMRSAERDRGCRLQQC